MIQTFSKARIIRVSPDLLPRAVAYIGKQPDAEAWKLRLITPEGEEKTFKYKK